MGIGAVSGIATAGIGQVFGAAGNFGHETARAFAHGFANGVISDLTGGDFGIGFLSGGLASLAGSGFHAIGGDFAQSAVGTLGFSAAIGGMSAELSGGDFWRGAATGATIAGLNHLAHKTFGGGDGPRNPKQDKKLTPQEIEALKRKGWDHKDKGRSGGGKKDLWYDPKTGDIYEKPKSGIGPGEPIDWNIRDVRNTVAVGAATIGMGYIIYKLAVALATWECFGCGVLLTP